MRLCCMHNAAMFWHLLAARATQQVKSLSIANGAHAAYLPIYLVPAAALNNTLLSTERLPSISNSYSAYLGDRDRIVPTNLLKRDS